MLAPYLISIDTREAGCDEAGRGCLAGPVVAAAVILHPDKPIQALNDSKQLSAAKRTELADQIMDRALAWAIAEIDPTEIDKVNILKASFLAMHKALDSLNNIPQHLLIDGNRFIAYKNIPHTCLVKGDARYQSIAAASILAKTHRDRIMHRLHLEFPQYNWCANKGYPTQSHRDAILSYGISPHHRRSFRLFPAGVQSRLTF
jgi:ribonuclease HII